MEVLHLPDNIKVHFAGCEVQNQYIALEQLGVQYGLYTCFPFVERMVFEKALAPIMPLRGMTNPAKDIPRRIANNMKHVIQDSGLFTLMFGARKGQKTEGLINKWYDKMVEFTLDNKTLGMALVMKGKHLCKTMRGAKSNGEMTVAHLSGEFKTNAECRAEFYRLIQAQG